MAIAVQMALAICPAVPFELLGTCGVQGDEALVYSKRDPSCCYHARYMDMVVVPSSMGEYGIINLGNTPCMMTKTMLK